MEGSVTWKVGAIEITRVADPGFELVLPQDPATTATLASTPWLAGWSLDDDMALRIGSTATVVRTPSGTLLVDPFLAFDDPARLGPRLSALRDAGVEADDVDVVVNTHVDGIGVNVLADGSPTFPQARYLVPADDLAALRDGSHPDLAGHPDTAALVALVDDGMAEAVTGGERPLPGISLEAAPGHSHGHVVVWVSSGGTDAVITGHLFLHPAQVADPDVAAGDVDPAALAATRRALLARCAATDAVLVGPLFSAPGGGTVRADGDTWRLDLDPHRHRITA